MEVAIFQPPHRMMGPETMQQASLQLPRQDALAAPPAHQKIKGEVLDVVMHIVTEALPVQSVQQRVASSVSNGAGSVSLTALPEFQ